MSKDNKRLFYCHEIESIKCCDNCHDEFYYDQFEPFTWEIGNNIFVTCCGCATIAKDRNVASKYIREARVYRRNNGKAN